MKVAIIFSTLLACTLGLPGYSAAGVEDAKFLVEYKTDLEATEVASQDSNTNNAAENSSTEVSGTGEDEGSSSEVVEKEKEPDTLIFGIIADVVIIVIIVVFACYQFNKMKVAKSRHNSYSRAP